MDCLERNEQYKQGSCFYDLTKIHKIWNNRYLRISTIKLKLAKNFEMEMTVHTIVSAKVVPDSSKLTWCQVNLWYRKISH